MREAELYDGTILEFPADTPDEVIARVAKEQTFLKQTSDMIQNPQAPEMTAGRAAGLAGRAAVQSVPGAIAGIPILVNDAVQQAGNWLYQGVDALAGTDLAGRHRQAWGGPFGTAKKWQERGERAADALGLPQPVTPEERVAVAGGQTALEALGGAGLAKAGEKATTGATQRVLADLGDRPIAQGVIGGLAGGGAQIAAENDVNPLIGMGLGLGAGISGAAVPALARQGVRSATEALDRALLRGEGVQRQAAFDRVRGAAASPEAALRDLEEGAGGELVAGSQPTTFQATGDAGLGSLERELQTNNPGAFAERRADQNSARLESLRSVQGAGNADEVVSFLRKQLDDIDRMTAGDEAAARSSAEGAAESLRPSDDAEGLGRSLRGRMQDAEEAARKRESALWNAVDPDGTLTVSPQSAKQIANEIYGKMTEAARLGVSRDERAIVDLIRTYKPVEAFRELLDLRSQIEAAKREELARRGRTASYGRLTQLSKAVQSGIENSAAERIVTDPAANSRFTAFVNDWDQLEAGGRTSGSNRAYGTLRPGAVSGMAGKEATQGRQFGTPAGGSGLQGQTGRGKPLSLTQFIAKNGGLPLDAEAAARDWGNVSVGRYGRLARRDGLSVDGYWRNKLIEAGYLPPDADGYASRDITKELYDLIEQERAGRKTFSAADEGQLGLSGADESGDELAAAAKQIREELQTVGVRPDEISSRAINEAADLLARGDEKDAVTAYERAVMSLEDEGPVRAEYAPREGSASAPAFEWLSEDTEAGKRYRAAADATRENRKTYGKGYAGQILRPGEDKASFRMGDASVTANAFRPGPTGGERIKAIVSAGGRMSDLAEMAALSLRKTALKADGTIDPAKFERWRNAHSSALRELPEDVRARFANASLASKALEQAAAVRKARLDEFNKSVLGKLAKIDTADLPKEIGKILNSSDAVAKMRKLSQAANGNGAAKEGLRRAVGEYIEARFISNKEVGTSGENGIRADAFASFVKDKGAALRLVFGGEELLRMQAIADDIKRAERSLYANKIPGNSNTAQDIGAALDKHAKKTEGMSLLTQVMIGAGGGGTFFGVPGVVTGAAGALGKHFLSSIRAAGLQKVDDLVLEIMLDPQLAKAALAKAPAKPDTGAQALLAHRLMRLAPLSIANSPNN